MTERARALHATADGQVAELIALVSTLDEAALRRPCPGREKLGDGTVGAIVRHTADNFQRIAELTDSQLGAIPPDGSFRFCDGQRTVEQVLASLVKHQGHQVQALRTALA